MKLNGLFSTKSATDSLDSTSAKSSAADSAFQSLLGDLIDQQTANKEPTNKSLSGVSTSSGSTVAGANASSTSAPILVTRVPDQESTFATNMDAIEAQYGGHATQSQILAGLYAMDPEGMKNFSSYTV